MTLEQIKQLKYMNLVSERDIDDIWTEYNAIFGIYPIGKKGCRACVRDSLIQLYKYYILENLKNN